MLETVVCRRKKKRKKGGKKDRRRSHGHAYLSTFKKNRLWQEGGSGIREDFPRSCRLCRMHIYLLGRPPVYHGVLHCTSACEKRNAKRRSVEHIYKGQACLMNREVELGVLASNTHHRRHERSLGTGGPSGSALLCLLSCLSYRVSRSVGELARKPPHVTCAAWTITR
ncbi:hypothetical protein P167DRAFT_218541 [Morchella conica CCBAS932]|uniref:Uncharacterized protein n=1 Tax=Morchella conica CCBAS932 TaxID=1392247 RepID=A0A3N4K743_9PEZI|nr:hypothetical protein P167DRAFT_218541 [Morchella conica CCBAS932]